MTSAAVVETVGWGVLSVCQALHSPVCDLISSSQQPTKGSLPSPSCIEWSRAERLVAWSEPPQRLSHHQAVGSNPNCRGAVHVLGGCLCGQAGA